MQEQALTALSNETDIVGLVRKFRLLKRVIHALLPSRDIDILFAEVQSHTLEEPVGSEDSLRSKKNSF